jgi:DNA-directed RNA polymerase alpha subunit
MIKVRINRRQRNLAHFRRAVEIAAAVTEVTYLAETDLPIRIINKLESIGIFTLQQLANSPRDKILEVRQLNKKSFDKIVREVTPLIQDDSIFLADPAPKKEGE